MRAEIATLRQILDVHEQTSHEQALKSEEALARAQREEERYRSLVAATTVVVWTVDETWQFIDEQPSWEAYTGQPWDEHQGFGWMNAIHPDDREHARVNWERARQTRTLFQSEGRLFHGPSSQYRFFVARAVPILNRDGSVHEWIGTVTDVDEQYRAEQSLRISDERFRVVSRATNDAVWDWNLATDTLWWNDAVRTLFGYMDHEVTPHITWWYEHCHPDDRDRVVAGIHAVIDSGATNWSDEYRFTRADGKYLDVLDRGFVIRDEGRKPVRMVGAMQDITDRKRRTVQLRQLSEVSASINSNLAPEKILQQITDAARELIGAHHALAGLATNAQGRPGVRTVSFSDAYALVNEAGLVGTAIGPMICETRNAIRLSRQDLSENPRWRSLAADSGTHSPVNGCLGAPLIGRDGETRGFVLLSDKHGEGFTAEDESVIVQLAQVASSAIENARLYEEARAANQAKDDFFAVLSHELRTPMTSIIGWTRLLTPDVDRETLAEAVAAIGTSAATQAQLVDDLLDISRMMAGKLSLDRKPLDLSTVVAEVIAALRPASTAKAVTLLLNSCDDCKLTGDSVRLRQVVSNLLSNAIKFTPRGGIVTTSVATEGNSAVVRVSDTGEGISREFLPRVFDRNAQSVSGRHGGLGLGLSIVKHIVEEHGGSVNAESAGEGKGATFTVRLPLTEAPA